MKDPKFIDRGDLISILLKDELFKDDFKMIIDESLTFFFAGSQSTGITTGNMIMYMLQSPEMFGKVKNEVNNIIINPYIAANPGKPVDLKEALTFENIFDL